MYRIIQRSVAAIATLSMLMFIKPDLAQTSRQSTPPSQSPLAATGGAFPDARLAQPLSRNEEAALRPMDHFKECERCPEMVVIPPGQFTMGASESEPGSTPDERPQHKVTFAQPFSVGRFAVTFDEWNACVIAGGCRYQPVDRSGGRGTSPVTNILWDEAKDYVWWLSRRTGRTYRLLSEAEREYVTRAGTTTAFWWGNSLTPLQFSSNGETSRPVVETEPQEVKTSPVASLAANPWGLYQVHGGVYDWVEDCWNDNYDGAPSDGSAWTTGNCSAHVLRGGAFGRPAQTLRSAARMWFGAPNRLIYMSVRVARTLAR
jgi:formylglycine-generating enzyme required for sulfatase activity